MQELGKKIICKNTDWAWLFGFIDGDGCFTCAVHERLYNKSKIPSITIAPRICIAQRAACKNVLNYVIKLTDCGKVYLKKEKSNNLNASEQAMWITGKLSEIEYICENLLPFIVHKKEQCSKMLELVKLRIEGTKNINRIKNERIALKNTLKCAELGLSLNPNATNGRNSQHNNEKRKWKYWKKRIPKIYKEAEIIINKRKERLNIKLICSTCNKEFNRYKSNIKKDTKNHYCSIKCRKIGEKITRS